MSRRHLRAWGSLSLIHDVIIDTKRLLVVSLTIKRNKRTSKQLASLHSLRSYYGTAGAAIDTLARISLQ